jgi:hypothetical protein
MEAGLLQKRDQLVCNLGGKTAVAIILRVSSMEPYIKLAIPFHFGWLTIASQPVVIDHRANPPTIL